MKLCNTSSVVVVIVLLFVLLTSFALSNELDLLIKEKLSMHCSSASLCPLASQVK